MDSKNGKRLETNHKKDIKIYWWGPCVIIFVFAIIMEGLLTVNNRFEYWVICFFLSFFAYAYILYFTCSLKDINAQLVGWRAFAVTSIVFLLVPCIIWCQYKECVKDYFSGYPDNGKIYAVVNRNIDQTAYNHLGDDYKYYSYINDREIVPGSTMKFNTDQPFYIATRIVESDSIPDVGVGKSVRLKWSENNNPKTIVTKYKIHIDENGGRMYPDAYADFEVSYALERVLPPGCEGITFLLSNYNNNREMSITLIIIEGGILFGTILCILLSLKRGKKESSKSTIDQQKENDSDRADFIERIKGTTIREIAGVPVNVSFVNGLPKDNSNSMYGTYTVYLSKNGKKFHEKKGCCAARYATNYIKALDKYSPCSKCCQRIYVKPQWFVEYTELMQKAHKYGIVVQEEE